MLARSQDDSHNWAEAIATIAGDAKSQGISLLSPFILSVGALQPRCLDTGGIAAKDCSQISQIVRFDFHPHLDWLSARVAGEAAKCSDG